MASYRTRKARNGETRVQARGNFPSRTFSGPSAKADARVYATEEERKTRLGEHYVAPTQRFGAFLDSYLKRKKVSWRESTYRSHLETKKDLKPLRSLALYDVGRADVEDLIDAIVARGAPRQAQKALALTKSVLHSARGRRFRVDESVFEIPVPKYEGKTTRFLNPEQVRHLASFAPRHIYRIILLAAYTGMRQGELLGLEDSDLNLTGAGGAGLRPAAHGGTHGSPTLEVRRGKTENAKRTIYLIPPAVVLLREQLIERKAGTSFVFPALKGGRYDRNDFMTKVFRPARKLAGMEDVTFHALRHTFVSLAAKEGLDEDVIAKVTGWSRKTVSSMMERYRGVYDEEVKEAVMRMEKAVS